MNNRGYVSTVVMFSMLIIFLISISILLGTMNNTNSLDKSIKDTISDKIEFGALNFQKIDTKIICKRASTLHTEKCEQIEDSLYCSGAGLKGKNITYGSLGNNGTLTSGDAFDCDVNGDGEYNSENERFYYVTDLDDDTAVLIYYNNVSSGIANNNKTFAYDSSGENFHGPRTAIKELPTTSQWNNIRLKNEIRAIKSSTNGNITTGGTLPNNYSYEGYSARLLTYSEMHETCGGNSLNSCTFLMENTKYTNSSMGTYGYWIENPQADTNKNAFLVYAYYSNTCEGISGVLGNIYYGVRPVIEISKINIEI